MVELLHDAKEMTDTVAYTCLLPLLPEYQQAGAVPHGFRRQDFAIRDSSRQRAYEAKFELPVVGFHAFVKNLAIVKVQCDLPKIIYGHNARLISSQDHVDLALSRVAHLLGLIATTTTTSGGMIPGKPIHESVHFTRLDFVWQFPDPEMHLATIIRNAVHPSIRRQNRQYANGTTLPGTDLTIKAYEKGSQLGIESQSRYVRLEVQMKGKKLRKLYHGDEDCRVTSLDFWESYKIYRSVMLGLDQKKIVGSGNTRTVAQTLAQIQLGDLVQDVAAIWIENRIKNSRAKRAFKKDFTAALSNARPFQFTQLLPAGSLPPVHEIRIPKKEDRLWNEFVQQFDWPTNSSDPLNQPPA